MGDIMYKILRGVAQVRNIIYDIYYTGNNLRKNSKVMENVNAPHSTDYDVLNEIFNNIQLKENDVFVDVGSGYGRVINYIYKKYSIKKIVGYEIVDEIATTCRKYINEEIEVLNLNILEQFPKDTTLFFLYNPFKREEDLRSFLELASHNSKKGTKIIFYGNNKKDIFSEYNFSKVSYYHFNSLFLKYNPNIYYVICKI